MAYRFNSNLTAGRLRDLLDYCPETGVFTRRVTVNNRNRAGSIAGYTGQAGYEYIGIDGTSFMSHRLAWLHVHGCWPAEEIDHINRDRGDNRIVNLRAVCRSVNNRNNSGRGYFLDKRSGKYRAGMTVNKRTVYLGSFDRAEDARCAYLAARDAIISKLTGAS